jgi:hypothetical protein
MRFRREERRNLADRVETLFAAAPAYQPSCRFYEFSEPN